MEQVTREIEITDFVRAHGFHVDFREWYAAVRHDCPVKTHETAYTYRQSLEESRNFLAFVFGDAVHFFGYVETE